MEFNQHFLGLEAEGIEDHTLEIVGKYIEGLLGEN
jgi:hypothetical protein